MSCLARTIRAALVLLIGCGDAPAAPPAATDDASERGRQPLRPLVGGDVAARPYATLAELHERAMVQSCASVEAACHAGSAYPELATLDALVATVGQPSLAPRLTMPLIGPGDPLRSYLVLRLVSDRYGAPMPEPCGNWDDRANQALVCAVHMMQLDEGAVIDPHLPIDYETCLSWDPALDVSGRGPCR